MNARRRLQREIVRRRLRHRRPWPAPTFTRITTPNGLRARVVFNPRQQLHGWGDKRATCFVPGATVYGPFPPTPDLIRELGRWA